MRSVNNELDDEVALIDFCDYFKKIALISFQLRHGGLFEGFDEEYDEFLQITEEEALYAYQFASENGEKVTYRYLLDCTTTFVKEGIFQGEDKDD